jgi:2-polyprenyl-3-methyl-5-hydroxy-6-metoxy-1,4-benzoquinol methylase
MQLQKLFLVAIAFSSLMFAGCTQQRNFDAQAQQSPTTTIETPASTEVEAPEPQLDVPYVPTPNEVVTQMLQLAKVQKGDVLYDLGSGDGRIVVTAAQKYGTRGVGIDINPERISEANANAQAAKVTDLVQFLQQDLFKTDLSEATVVTLYLLPDINVRLRSQLFKQLKPGTRIVSHDFDMGEWKPERVVQVQGPTRQHTLYYWTVPETVPANLQ